MYTGILFAFPLGLKETYNDDIYFLSAFLSLPSRKNSVCMVELYSFLKRILTQNIFLMSEHDFFSASTLLFGTVYWALMISSVPWHTQSSNMARRPSGNILEIFDRMKVCMFSFFNFITVFKYPLYLYFKRS